MTNRVSREPERPRRFHRQSGWGDRNRQLPGPRWDAQLQKDFVVGPVRLGLIGSVFNILDTEIPIQRDGNVGDGGTIADPTNPGFNFSTAWQRPRSYEVGFRVEF